MKRVKQEEEETKSKLQFYRSLPTNSIQYSEFVQYVDTRIKLLRRLESNTLFNLESMKMKDDILQHFFSMLICSQSEWTGKWFVSMETLLFKKKLDGHSDEKIDECFAEEIMRRVVLISTENNEKDGNFRNVKSIPPINSMLPGKHENQSAESLRIHWSWVPDLVLARKIELKNGYTELNCTAKRSALVALFKMVLNSKMAELQMKRMFDERLFSLHTRLFSVQTPVSSSSIEDAIKYAPSCILSMLEKLKSEHHLKYFDRQNLCLYFKDAGVPLNDTIHFFRSQFKKGDFDKEYLYNIRHNYGMVGKRANYSSFPCKKIISSSKDINCTGCPFTKDFEDFNCQIECTKQLISKIKSDSNIDVESERPVLGPIEYFKLWRKNSKDAVEQH